MDDLDPKNPPAFPAQHVDLAPFERGMTLRDYFAANAMQAIMINSDSRSVSAGEVESWIGSYAYRVADAMLAERQK